MHAWFHKNVQLVKSILSGGAAAGSPAAEATIKVICHKLADEGGQPTRGSSEDEDEYQNRRRMTKPFTAPVQAPLCMLRKTTRSRRHLFYCTLQPNHLSDHLSSV